MPSQQGLTVAEIFERHGLRELHGPDVITAVPIDDALGRNNLIEGNAVLIVATIRPVHDKAPHAARTKIMGMRRGGEAVRPPPLREMLRVCPYREHQCARRVEHARADDRTRIALEVDTIFYGHRFLPAWFVSVGLAVPSGSRRADRAALPRVGDTPRAIGRLP